MTAKTLPVGPLLGTESFGAIKSENPLAAERRERVSDVEFDKAFNRIDNYEVHIVAVSSMPEYEVGHILGAI